MFYSGIKYELEKTFRTSIMAKEGYYLALLALYHWSTCDQFAPNSEFPYKCYRPAIGYCRLHCTSISRELLRRTELDAASYVQQGHNLSRHYENNFIAVSSTLRMFTRHGRLHNPHCRRFPTLKFSIFPMPPLYILMHCDIHDDGRVGRISRRWPLRIFICQISEFPLGTASLRI